MHKIANVLDKLPRGVQGPAKTRIHNIDMAATKAKALEAFEEFMISQSRKSPRPPSEIVPVPIPPIGMAMRDR